MNGFLSNVPYFHSCMMLCVPWDKWIRWLVTLFLKKKIWRLVIYFGCQYICISELSFEILILYGRWSGNGIYLVVHYMVKQSTFHFHPAMHKKRNVIWRVRLCFCMHFNFVQFAVSTSLFPCHPTFNHLSLSPLFFSKCFIIKQDFFKKCRECICKASLENFVGIIFLKKRLLWSFQNTS